MALTADYYAEKYRKGKGWCLSWVQDALGVPHVWPSAAAGWQLVRQKSTDQNPPPGAVVWWTGGSKGHGHVAISLGGGRVRSTDMTPEGRYEGTGRISDVSIAQVTAAMRLRYAGWSRDISGVTVCRAAAPAPAPVPAPAPAPASGPQVSLSAVIAAARADGARPQGGTTPGAGDDVLIVERALQAEGLLVARLVDGSYGTSTRTAYAAWQRSLGYSGRDADGVPGQKSLAALGTRHGFGVVA